ncbi:hypothetical protein NQ314_006071 [Rhamnusium bicolor]|uniref:PiggyBac transposable element-derived protein domain-containing protein n=1 Tax=Rhamnusium bicolor TaxID=1586634 RepID=A0AAV8Z9N7_9CUCU|nr:hypothetical protein NQ314_006071 [Rhamnusium bicolor]
MKKFFGLCLLAGQLKFRSIRSLFSLDPLYYHPIFSSTISGRRFEQILRCLNCSDVKNKEDPLFRVSWLLKSIILSSQDMYSPQEALSLDESLLLFRGKLLSKCLQERKTHTTGTLRSNRKHNPKKITEAKLRAGEHVWRRCGNIYVSKWRDKRDVLAITTGYQPKLIETTNKYGQNKLKPIEVAGYNANMSEIDRVDQKINYYSCPRKSIRWKKKVIFHILDIAV